MFRKSIALLMLLALVSYAQAHFIWLIPGDKPNTVKLVFGDKLGPDLDNPDLIDKVKQTGLYIHDPGSKHIDLVMQREPGAFAAALPDKAHVIRGKCVYGIFQRGDNPPSLLNYYCIYKKGDLKDLIWTVNETIEHLSAAWTLQPGDLIFTGTPAGVAAVVRGDVMQGAIAGLGTLKVAVR